MLPEEEKKFIESAQNKRKFFLELQKHYGFAGIKAITLLAASDVLTRLQGRAWLDSLEKSTTYEELFFNLKVKIPALGEEKEMIYFLLLGLGLFENDNNN